MHCRKGRERGKTFRDFLQEGNVVSPASEEYDSPEFKSLEKKLLAMQLEDLDGTAEKKPLDVPPFEMAPYFI
jgi:hypothetical protein